MKNGSFSLKLSPVRLAPDPLGDFSPAVAELSPLKLSPVKLSPLKLSPVKPSPHHEHDKRITGPKVLPAKPESQLHEISNSTVSVFGAEPLRSIGHLSRCCSWILLDAVQGLA